MECVIMNQEKVWDEIAPAWSEYRIRMTSTVRDLLENCNGKILDLGCGSGRNFLEKDGLEFYGVDFSERMVKFAREKGYVEVKKSASWDLDYGKEFFDCLICIALLNCVENEGNRKKTVEEMFRVLRSGGRALIVSWGRGSKRIKNQEKETFVRWSVGAGKIEERYTYIYDLDELVSLVEKVGFIVEKAWEDKNVCVIVRRE